MTRTVCLVFCGLILMGGGFAATDATPPELPSHVDLRPQLDAWGLGPRAQGSRGTCSVFTTTAALEFAYAKRTGKPVVFSPEYLNWAADKVHGNMERDGQFFSGCIDGFRVHGICPESDMPYQREFHADRQPSAAALADATRIRDLGFEFHWVRFWHRSKGMRNWQVKDIREVLAKGYPVGVGSDHSRLMVGYRDDESAPGGGVFFTKDSGSARYDFISYQWVQDNGNDSFWVEIPQKPAEKQASAS